MVRIGNDGHFNLLYRPGLAVSSKNEKKQQKEFNEINQAYNFGFDEVKRLKGNIGFIKFSGFAEPKSSALALASAMNFISNTNAPIIDLRNNNGGDGKMTLLFCSYFFSQKTLLSEALFRFDNSSVKNWTRQKRS